MKLVINSCYGGFGVSYEGMKRYFQLKGWDFYAATFTGFDGPLIEVTDPKTAFVIFYFKNHIPVDREESSDEINARFELAGNVNVKDIPRHDPELVRVVEELGSDAYGRHAKLTVCDIPSGYSYRITEYDGYESIELRDNIDWEIAA